MKIIIGIMRDSSNKIQSYIDKGYHIEHIDSHVRTFGETLLKMKLDEEGVDKVRKRGYKVNPRFWVNIAIMSAKGKEKIVIDKMESS